MRHLVTGGAGFIGSHLVEYLVSKNNTVIVLDDFSSGNVRNLKNIQNSPFFEVVRGSTLDRDLINGLMKSVDTCFHLSAVLGVKKIIDDPIKALELNIWSTAQVLESASKYKVKTLMASSSEIYGRNANMPLNEESDRVLGSPKIARWSYSESKAINELYAFNLNLLNDFEVVVARLFNTVGIRQNNSYGVVLPNFVKAALINNPIYVYGDGTQTRSFCAVSDVVVSLVELLHNPLCIGQAFNIGSDSEITITDLAHTVVKTMGSKSKVESRSYEEVFGVNFEEPKRRVPDISKIKNFTGWYPKKSLEDIVIELSEYLAKDAI
jgi:UDP-glucose 4-epimerase